MVTASRLATWARLAMPQAHRRREVLERKQQRPWRLVRPQPPAAAPAPHGVLCVRLARLGRPRCPLRRRDQPPVNVPPQASIPWAPRRQACTRDAYVGVHRPRCRYGVSCHGGDFKGLARNKRCTQRNDFSKTGGTNGDYKMDHGGTHSGTTRCISGTTGIGVGKRTRHRRHAPACPVPSHPTQPLMRVDGAPPQNCEAAAANAECTTLHVWPERLLAPGHYFRSCADAAKVGAKAKC